MRGLICDVINYCALSFGKKKLSIYDQIVIKNLKNRTDDIKHILHEFLYFWFVNWIHSLLNEMYEMMQQKRINHLNYMIHIAQIRLKNCHA